MAQFFINRPIFAWVIAILLTLAGLLSLKSLPVSAYPNIAPPQILVSAFYPGASAEVIENTVTSLIEQEMNGIDGLKYVISSSSAIGTASTTLVFETGTDLDIAAVDVQNRLKTVEPSLPEAVRRQGVSLDKTRPDSLMVIALSSPNGTHSATAMNDFIDAQILGDIRRVKGVGYAQQFGSRYAMRIWLDPLKMTAYQITPAEVYGLLGAQNAQLATGQVGSAPAPTGQQLNMTVYVPAALNQVSEFEDVILKTTADGATVRLKDVANVERGQENYQTTAELDGKETAAFQIKLTNSGNALETASLIKAKMTEFEKTIFPDDVTWTIPYDTSLFAKESIIEVLKTLLEAVVLVAVIMFLFLQSWRTVLIPLIVVPVSLIATCIVLKLAGFSLNMLTLFGMVLAIGIVVDDAIIVVENIERLIHEENLSPYQASVKGMKQIGGAIIGTTAVLVSVFIPMAFFGGSVGEIYKQFSITIATSILFSSFFALSLSPAIAQGLLLSKKEEHTPIWPFRVFNRGLDWLTEAYMAVVGSLFAKAALLLMVVAYLAIVAADYRRFQAMPTGFVPEEDQGFFVVGAMLPPAASFERTKTLTDKTDAWLREQPEIDMLITVNGFGFAGQGQNVSISFVRLREWAEREEMRSIGELIGATNMAFQQFGLEGLAFAGNLPPIPGMGTEVGFDFWLKKQPGTSDMAYFQAVGQLMAGAKQSEIIDPSIRPNTLPPAPQVVLDVDRDKAQALGISIDMLNTTLQLALGSGYVNDYIEDGNVRQVWVQADPKTRSSIDDILKLQVRNQTGGLVDLSEIAQVDYVSAPVKLDRYNGVRAIEFLGKPLPGKSSGDAIAKMQEIAATFPKGISYEWSGQSREEIESGDQAGLLFALSIIVIFLVLSALYESWAVPLSVMLVVPIGVLGCLAATMISQLPNDVYFKVGIITIIGLSAKNAILIVEFAREAQIEGKKLLDAVEEACRLRFRPILMTSFAFILGILPLVTASGAGSASRKAIGISVMGGMISATVLAIFFVPVFYILVRKLFPHKMKQHEIETLKQSESMVQEH